MEETKEKEEIDKGEEKPEASNVMDEAKALNEELKKTIDERKKLLEREEKLRAEELLSGRGEGGRLAPKPEEETDEQYSAKVLNGEINPLQ